LHVSQGSSSALTKVVTNGTFSVSSPGSVSAVQPGDTVIVRGVKQSNGSLIWRPLSRQWNQLLCGTSPAWWFDVRYIVSRVNAWRSKDDRCERLPPHSHGQDQT